MTKDGQHLYFEENFMQQPNHARVLRLLHELEFVPHEDRRHADAARLVAELDQPASLTDWHDRRVVH